MTQTNDKNQVALVYHNPTQVMPNGYQYVFVPQAGISMAWVNQEHVAAILAMRGGCCSGKKQLFNYANETQVRIWANRGGS